MPIKSEVTTTLTQFTFVKRINFIWNLISSFKLIFWLVFVFLELCGWSCWPCFINIVNYLFTTLHIFLLLIVILIILGLLPEFTLPCFNFHLVLLFSFGLRLILLFRVIFVFIVTLFFLNFNDIAFLRHHYFENFFDCQFFMKAILALVIDLGVIGVGARFMTIHDPVECSRYAAVFH